ncbi:MAG: L,D-transpeptidase [bacterium]|nr:L,D-transpeptidase [bacterium]
MMKQIRVVIAVLVLLVVMIAPAHAQMDTTACAEVVPNGEIPTPCMRLMESFPAPTVLEIPQDRFTLDYYDFWRVNNTQPPVYDAPGGNVIRNMPAGFNFINVVNQVEGWVQAENGEWFRAEDVLQNDKLSYMSGVRILDGLENRFAWILGTMYTVPEPNGAQSPETGRLVQRYDLVNIFAETVDSEGWRWYMVGPNQWVEQRMVAKVFKIDRPEGVEGRWVAVDLYEQTLVAYENDTPIFATLIATGIPGFDTREGVYPVWARLDRDRMSGLTGAPNAWDLQSVPYVMYFDEGRSLHGTYWHDNFGYRQSKGCVNLTISDASYVFTWMSETTVRDEEGNPLNFVYVHSSGEYVGEGAATK